MSSYNVGLSIPSALLAVSVLTATTADININDKWRCHSSRHHDHDWDCDDGRSEDAK
jgi:hypothetical protein